MRVSITSTGERPCSAASSSRRRYVSSGSSITWLMGRSPTRGDILLTAVRIEAHCSTSAARHMPSRLLLPVALLHPAAQQRVNLRQARLRVELPTPVRHPLHTPARPLQDRLPRDAIKRDQRERISLPSRPFWVAVAGDGKRQRPALRHHVHRE